MIYHTTLFILGLVSGSFLNVVIYRLPRGESIVSPPSHCPECGNELSPLELIPVISYIMLRGRCRECGSKISVRYPLVELGTGLIFLANAYIFTEILVVITGIVLGALLLVLSLIDIDRQILPDKLTILGLALGLIMSFIRPDIHPLTAVAGVFAGGGFLFVIAFVSKGGLGGGDIKMMAFVGSFIGPAQVMLAIFLGAFIGLVANVPGLIGGKVGLKSRLPFGPFLAVASIIMWFFGSSILSWYLNLIG